MRYYHPSTESWSEMPYMVKEHSVVALGYTATVVVVPFSRTNKKGEEGLVFVPMGVRIEEVNRPVYGQFTLPGYNFFFNFYTKKVSETEKYSFKTDRIGRPLNVVGLFPEINLPSAKFAGVDIDKHRLKGKISELVAKAQASYAAYREEQRLLAIAG